MYSNNLVFGHGWEKYAVRYGSIRMQEDKDILVHINTMVCNRMGVPGTYVCNRENKHVIGLIGMRRKGGWFQILVFVGFFCFRSGWEHAGVKVFARWANKGKRLTNRLPNLAS